MIYIFFALHKVIIMFTNTLSIHSFSALASAVVRPAVSQTKAACAGRATSRARPVLEPDKIVVWHAHPLTWGLPIWPFACNNVRMDTLKVIIFYMLDIVCLTNNIILYILESRRFANPLRLFVHLYRYGRRHLRRLRSKLWELRRSSGPLY